MQSFSLAVKLRRRLLVQLKTTMSDYGLSPEFDWAAFPEARSMALAWRKIRVIQSPGPDHVVLGCSLSPSKDHVPLPAIYTLIMSSVAASLIQLGLGADDPDDTRPIRGGIDLAPGSLVAPEDVLYSPAVMRAYNLERVAVYPRILVGSRVAELLDSYASSKPTHPVQAVASAVARRLRTMLFVDPVDGKLALDFFGDSVRQTLDSPEATALAHKAWEYASRALEKARTSQLVDVTEKAKIIAKYEWLVSYMTPRKALWGIP
jgi:hypothetical protein